MKYNNKQRKIKDTRKKDIEVLIADNCTEYEAIKHIQNGTIVYDNVPEYVESVKESFCGHIKQMEDFLEDECVKDWKEYEKKITDGKCTDVSTVMIDGHLYIINYCL